MRGQDDRPARISRRSGGSGNVREHPSLADASAPTPPSPRNTRRLEHGETRDGCPRAGRASSQRTVTPVRSASARLRSTRVRTRRPVPVDSASPGGGVEPRAPCGPPPRPPAVAGVEAISTTRHGS